MLITSCSFPVEAVEDEEVFIFADEPFFPSSVVWLSTKDPPVWRSDLVWLLLEGLPPSPLVEVPAKAPFEPPLAVALAFPVALGPKRGGEGRKQKDKRQ